MSVHIDGVPNITHHKHISNSPALALAVKAWAELLANNLTLQEIMIAWDHQAFVFAEEFPIAVLTYVHQEYNDTYSICIGWVDPAFRQRKIYTLLWEALITRARKEKVKVISSSVAINNIPMRHVAATQHRFEGGVYLRYEL